MTERTGRIAATLLLLLLSPLSLLAQTAMERVRQSGELRVGTDATYPPFETVEGDVYSGFDIDLMEAVARELGVRAR